MRGIGLTGEMVIEEQGKGDRFERNSNRQIIFKGFRESDYDDLCEFLSQLEDSEFEGYPGITYENGREHLKYRVDSEEFYGVE